MRNHGQELLLHSHAFLEILNQLQPTHHAHLAYLGGANNSAYTHTQVAHVGDENHQVSDPLTYKAWSGRLV